MENLFYLLESKALKRNSFKKSEEYHYFLNNRYLLDKFPNYRFLYHSEDNSFDVMRANIILHGIENKKIIEEEIASLSTYLTKSDKESHIKFISTIRDRIIDLPYFSDGKNKIYIPFFTRTLNGIYLREPEKLLTFPYDKLIKDYSDSFIDPYDNFSYHIYNSSFTRLIFLGTSSSLNEAAFFHYDTNIIYIINSQGRLDQKIVLFDKYIKHPNYSHMLNRIKPVISAYFACSRTEFIEALYKSGFISNRLLYKLRKMR